MAEDIAQDDAEGLRKFIVKHYAAGAFEIDGRILVENMEHVYQWVRHGTVPKAASKNARKLSAAELKT